MGYMEQIYDSGSCACRTADYDFDEFSERVLNIVFEEMGQMYEECRGKTWDTVEDVLRGRLVLKNSFRTRQRRSEDYLKLLNDRGCELYSKLKNTRQALAMRAGYPPYVVFSNRTLFEMCVVQPSSEAEMEQLYGAGVRSVSRFGRAFLRDIQSYNGGEHIEMRSEEYIEKGESGFPLIFGKTPKSGSVFDTDRII